ncbi:MULTISPECIES: acetyltransferase [Bradyrhizobium]|uniref:acetyltransferase n=1 Tax=Bradyrhizobium TaxID=374 RepID=UPI001EDAC1D8|nr:acetyltransferase [Bradyrhizobium zhengyangense]
MLQKRFVVLGGPGDGLVVAEALHHAARAGHAVELVGFLNDVLPPGEILQGVPVLGRFEDWRKLDNDILFSPAVQKVKDMQARVARINSLEIPEERWGTVVHPSAVVSSDVVIGPGAFVASCATVQPESRIGRFASLRAGAMLGHHCVVEDHGYVGPNATMCGRSTVGFGAHLGPGSVLLDSKKLGEFSVVGIAAAVTKDVPDRWVVFGNPAVRVGTIARLSDQR